MRRELRLVMPGKPQSLQRSRQSKDGHRFDSSKNVENKAYIRLKAEAKARDEGVVTPIPPGGKGYTMTIFVRVKPPKSFPKWKLKLIEEGKLFPKTVPDLDNVLKLWSDSLMQGGIIEDDRNITSKSIFRRYANEDEVECVLYWDEGEEDDVW